MFKLIVGVEVLIKWESFEIYIVGLNVDDENDLLLLLL